MELNISSVSKRYGPKLALKDFSASLTPGVYGILGPNGAGKTTLMNIITDNIAPTSGIVSITVQIFISSARQSMRPAGS